MLLKLDALSPDHLQTPVRTRSRRDLPPVEEIDPLSLIEIKSAIQWKEMSKRISFNFDLVIFFCNKHLSLQVPNIDFFMLGFQLQQ